MLNDKIAPKTSTRLSSPDSVLIAEQDFHEVAIAFAKMLVHNPYSPRMEGMIKLVEQKYERLESAIAFERADDAAASAEKSKTRTPSTP
jgi:hypothetical protein